MIFIDTKGHLTTDGDAEEVHAFALRLGLKRRWYQNHARHPHYDVTSQFLRKRAVTMGANLVQPKELVRRCFR